MAGAAHVAAEGDERGLGEVDGAVGAHVADAQLHGGVVARGDHAVGVVALARQEDVRHLVLVVDGAPHPGLQVPLPSCFHGYN